MTTSQANQANWYDHPTLIKISRWLIFSVIFALVPIALNYFLLLASSLNSSLLNLLQHGELLLICAAISADAIGDIIGSGKKKRLIKLIAGGGCTLVLFFTSGAFAIISLRLAQSVIQPNVIPLDPGTVSCWSISLFTFTLIASGSCKWLGD